MNRFIKIALATIGLPVVAVATINALPTHLQPAASGGSTFVSDVENNQAMLMAENRVRQMLKDPDSAKFGAVYLIASTNSVPLPRPATDTVCGYVNAKNSFGAYTGASMFIAIPGVIPDITPPEVGSRAYNRFVRVWNRECTGKKNVASL